MNSIKKKAIWTVIFVLLVVLTLYAVGKQNKSFSVQGFLTFISNANPVWVVLAFMGVVGFIVFEALAITTLTKAFGYKRNVGQGIFFSAPDIYFSAITPSATGGQPASGLFMMRSGIPGAVTTIILLINVTLYTIAVLVIGLVCFITRGSMFLGFSWLSQTLIIAGFVIQSLLTGLFIMLIYKEKIVMKIANGGMKFLTKIHLMHNLEKRQKKLKKTEEKYRQCAQAIKNNKRNIAKAFVYNLLQRLSLIMVSVCVFIGVDGGISRAYDALVAQGFVVLGSNSVPIPGAMGAADYLFIDTYGSFANDISSTNITNIELFSRGISFYICIIICGIITMAAYAGGKIKKVRDKKKC